MRRDTFQQLLDGLAGISASPEAKRQFEKLIRYRAALDGIAMPARAERVTFARQLLDVKTPRAAIRDRLMVRFEVGESQAYRDIGEALGIVPKRL